jgi:hypothetical protein
MVEYCFFFFFDVGLQMTVHSSKSDRGLIILAVKEDFTDHSSVFWHCTRLFISVPITQKQTQLKGCGQNFRSKIPILQMERIIRYYYEFQPWLRDGRRKAIDEPCSVTGIYSAYRNVLENHLMQVQISGIPH